MKKTSNILYFIVHFVLYLSSILVLFILVKPHISNAATISPPTYSLEETYGIARKSGHTAEMLIANQFVLESNKNFTLTLNDLTPNETITVWNDDLPNRGFIYDLGNDFQTVSRPPKPITINTVTIGQMITYFDTSGAHIKLELNNSPIIKLVQNLTINANILYTLVFDDLSQFPGVVADGDNWHVPAESITNFTGLKFGNKFTNDDIYHPRIISEYDGLALAYETTSASGTIRQLTNKKTINYVDRDGNPLIQPFSISQVSTYGLFSTLGHQPLPVIDNYHPVVIPDGAVTDSVISNDGDEADLVFTVIYEKDPIAKGTVQINYVDTNSTPIYQSRTITGDVGSTYVANTAEFKPSISGYTLKSDQLPNNATGTFTDQLQTITYIYTKNEPQIKKDGQVTIRFLDDKGNEILANQVIKGPVGNSYQTTEKKITGYSLKKITGETKGQFTETPSVVTYTYSKLASNPPIIKPDKPIIKPPVLIPNKPSTNDPIKNQPIVQTLNYSNSTTQNVASQNRRTLPQTSQSAVNPLILLIGGVFLLLSNVAFYKKWKHS